MDSAKQKAMKILGKFSGPIRTSEMKDSGIHSRTIKALLEDGTLEKLTKGVYQLKGTEFSSHPDLVIVSTRHPQAYNMPYFCPCISRDNNTNTPRSLCGS